MKQFLFLFVLAMPLQGIASSEKQYSKEFIIGGCTGISLLIIAAFISYKIYDKKIKDFEDDQFYDVKNRERKLLKIHDIFINNPSIQQVKGCKQILDEEEVIYQEKEKRYPHYHKQPSTGYLIHRKELNAVANIELTYQRVIAGEKLEDVLLELNPLMTHDDMAKLVFSWVDDCEYGIVFYMDGNVNGEKRRKYLSKGHELLKMLERQVT